MDLEAAGRSVDGVMLRAGYGRGNLDRQFRRNAGECVRLGIPFGAYWFSYAHSPELARAEARALLAAVEAYDPALPLAFDWEYDSRDHAARQGVTVTAALAREMAEAFCGEVEAAGRTCLLYANPDFIARYFGDLAGGRFPLWLAQWPGGSVDVKRPPRDCAMWQWGTGTVPGVKGSVDMNEGYALAQKERLPPEESPSSGASGHLPPEGEGRAWYAPAMAWAKETGILDGTRPEAFATRAEVAQMFYNLRGEKPGGA